MSAPRSLPAPVAVLEDERGVALILTMFIALTVSVLAMGSVMLAVNSSVIQKYQHRQSLLIAVADAGLEKARSRLNADASLYPDAGYRALETDVRITDVYGDTVPGVRRTTYVGPTGIASGQYGVTGSVVTVVTDEAGVSVIRRREISQESFAIYAYFTDDEGGSIWFGGGDQLFGPVHSNDQIKIHQTGVTFHGPVTTAEDVLQPSYGEFRQGYEEDVPRIDLPEMADLQKLRTQAQAGSTVIDAGDAGAYGEPRTRLEFVALDLNGDGDTADRNEGFVKVYRARRSSDSEWVVSARPDDYYSYGLRRSDNCGGLVGGVFVPASDLSSGSWLATLMGPTGRCHLGGSDSLWGGFQASDGYGDWVRWPGSVDAAVAGRADAEYLWPINRPMNPSFKGVIYVDGDVAISGVLRGRLTLAATGDVVIADDVTYATDPAAGSCADILGVFGGRDVIVADNTVNAPTVPGSGAGYTTFDDSKDERIHAVILALRNFTVQGYGSGARTAEACETSPWGRGCLYLTGGIIQDTRGAVGTTAGTGYLKRYAYDPCAFSDPPPYFPTTGHFKRGQYFEVDANAFDVDDLFDRLSAP